MFVEMRSAGCDAKQMFYMNLIVIIVLVPSRLWLLAKESSVNLPISKTTTVHVLPEKHKLY